MKSQKPAPMKMATAPFQPRTGAYASARLSESTRALVGAVLATDFAKQKTEEAPKLKAEAVKSDSDRP